MVWGLQDLLENLELENYISWPLSSFSFSFSSSQLQLGKGERHMQQFVTLFEQ